LGADAQPGTAADRRDPGGGLAADGFAAGPPPPAAVPAETERAQAPDGPDGIWGQGRDQHLSLDGPDPEPERPGAAPGGPEAEPETGPAAEPAAQPRTILGWLAFPFVAVWRFLFPKKPRPFVVELPFLVVFALFLAFLIKTFLVQAFFIPSGSMQNTLAIGDRVLVNRASQWLGGQPQRGQVVVFQDPGGWLLPNETTSSSNWLSKALTFVGVLPEDNGDLIKRVIGVGGDHVVCCNANGQITVNGVALNESYLYPGDTAQSGPDGAFDVIVPQGRLWVMGDHRSVSEDSRAHVQLNGGTIPVSAVVGRADLIIWPISHWGTLPVPDTFKQTGLSALAAPGGVPAAAVVGALPVTLLRRRLRLRGVTGRAQADSDKLT
jgi:signal peptidase I